MVYNSRFYEELFGLMGWKAIEESFNEEYNVFTSFVSNGEVLIELVVPAEDSLFKRNLRKTGNNIHHIAFTVADIDNSIGRYEALGYRFLSNKPVNGFRGCRVAFMDPLSSKGILIELIEAKD
jgi:methylmalonyl-CoA epimerase